MVFVTQRGRGQRRFDIFHKKVVIFFKASLMKLGTLWNYENHSYHNLYGTCIHAESWRDQPPVSRARQTQDTNTQESPTDTQARDGSKDGRNGRWWMGMFPAHISYEWVGVECNYSLHLLSILRDVIIQLYWLEHNTIDAICNQEQKIKVNKYPLLHLQNMNSSNFKILFFSEPSDRDPWVTVSRSELSNII